MAKIISVNNNKGGIGKTSLVTNLAGVLAQKHKVLIVDTDGQGNVAMTFGISPDELEYSLYDVLMEGVAPKRAILSIEGIDILPSNSDMDFFDMNVLTNMDKYPNPFYILRDKLQDLADLYDYVLIDSPPSLGLIAGNILSFAEHVLVPFQPEAYAVRGLVRLNMTIDSFREQHNDKLHILGVVPMLYDSRTSLHRAILQEADTWTQVKGIRLFETIIPKSIRFASSVAFNNKPATLTDKNNSIVHAYYELADEIMEVI